LAFAAYRNTRRVARSPDDRIHNNHIIAGITVDGVNTRPRRQWCRLPETAPWMLSAPALPVIVKPSV